MSDLSDRIMEIEKELFAEEIVKDLESIYQPEPRIMVEVPMKKIDFNVESEV